MKVNHLEAPMNWCKYKYKEFLSEKIPCSLCCRVLHKKICRKIKLLFINLHGVLGSSNVIQNNKNKLFCSDIQDGMGVTLAYQAGLKVIVAIDNPYPSSLRRAKSLKTAKQTVINNMYEYKKILEEFNAGEDETAWVASNIESLSFFKSSGLKIAVPEAPEEIKKIAHLITTKPGGEGALREAIEFIVKQQGKWQILADNYILNPI